jgi:hypothetical protein
MIDFRWRVATWAGWQVDKTRRGTHRGTGLALRERNRNYPGKYTDRYAQWRPGPNRHGPKPYWKLSSGNTGKVYIPR